MRFAAIFRGVTLSLGLGALMLPSVAEASDFGPMILGFALILAGVPLIFAAAAAALWSLFKRKWSWMAFGVGLTIGIGAVAIEGPDVVRWVNYLDPGYWKSPYVKFEWSSIDEKIRESHAIIVTEYRWLDRPEGAPAGASPAGPRKHELIVKERLKGGMDPARESQLGIGQVGSYLPNGQGFVIFFTRDTIERSHQYRYVGGRFPQLDDISLEELREKVQKQK